MDESQRWLDAMDRDGNSPSHYPKVAPRFGADTSREDFAETVTLYLLVRDQPGVSERDKERFKILDDIFAKP